MKFIIFTVAALAAGTFASDSQLDAHDIEDMLARSIIDPKTINPTKLSVLRILKTAVPSGDFSHATGDSVPDWVENLPWDVKSLLPELYSVETPSPSATVSSSNVSLAPSPCLHTSSISLRSLIPCNCVFRRE
jgi:hypothetical protein